MGYKHHTLFCIFPTREKLYLVLTVSRIIVGFSAVFHHFRQLQPLNVIQCF